MSEQRSLAYSLGYHAVAMLKHEVPRFLLYGFIALWWAYNQWGWRPPG